MFKQWFSSIRSSSPVVVSDAGVPNLRQAIKQRLTELNELDVDYLAATAGLMMDVAHSDLNISAAEKKYVVEVLSSMTSLSALNCQALVDVACGQKTTQGSDNLHAYLRIINAAASAEQKEELLHVLFGLAASDGEVGQDEEGAIKLIASALHIRQRQFAEIRQHFADKRAVLRNLKLAGGD
jgi:uncharacterized tellurite resistance protein B-like protein